MHLYQGTTQPAVTVRAPPAWHAAALRVVVARLDRRTARSGVPGRIATDALRRGALSVPLMLHHVQAVVFILNDMHTDVIGTGFVVRFEESLGDTLTHVDYVVTAKHCVEGAWKPAIRIPTEGPPKDLVIETWFHHDTEDVSVAILPNSVIARGYVRGDEFLDAAPGPFSARKQDVGLTQLGDRVYFCGFLAELPAMAHEATPMVRSGTLGATDQVNVTLRRPDGTPYVPKRVHLVDCRSYQGFSGSPCFVQFDHTQVVEGESRGRLAITTALLGMFVAHFRRRVRV